MQIMMEPTTPTAIVLAWQEAVNQKDAQQLLALSDPNIEIVGPRGSAYGHEILEQWLERAGLSMAAYRCFANGNTVVVAQHGVWRNVETDEVMGEADIASRFRVKGEQITCYARYNSLTDALNAAHLTDADEQPLTM
jgi:hypothetical protein